MPSAMNRGNDGSDPDRQRCTEGTLGPDPNELHVERAALEGLSATLVRDEHGRLALLGLRTLGPEAEGSGPHSASFELARLDASLENLVLGREGHPPVSTTGYRPHRKQARRRG